MTAICEQEPSCCAVGWAPACAQLAAESCTQCEVIPEPTPGQCLELKCELATCANYSACAPGLECMLACGDYSCAQTCMDAVGSHGEGMLAEILACGVAATCFGPPIIAPPAPVCGDGQCEGDELNTCPADCGGVSGGCLVESCAPGNCNAYEECADALGCMSACETVPCAENCLSGVAAPVQGMLSGVVACGFEAFCFPGTPPYPVCDDGICDPTELVACLADCEGAGDLCLVENCEMTGCLLDPLCGESIVCMLNCGDSACAEGCVQTGDEGTMAMMPLMSGAVGVTEVSFWIPSDDALGTSWTSPGFDDGAWSVGPQPLGYETSPADYKDLLETEVIPTSVSPEATSVLVRASFEAAGPDAYS